MGMPCVFIRLAGCNLRCAFCDTPRASWEPVGQPMTVAELTQITQKWPDLPIVITGGEPFLFDELPALCQSLKEEGHAVHIETAGTLFCPVHADLLCISPKLSSSIPKGEPWASRHQERIANTSSLLKWRDWNHVDLYFKYVVESHKDVLEVLAQIQELNLPKQKVFLMPKATSVQELNEIGPQVAQWCLDHGIRYSDRLHVRLWNNEPGR